MVRKVIGIVIVGLLIATMIPLGSAQSQESKEKANSEYESKLFAIGFIRIQSDTCEITGFALVGMNTGQLLVLQKIDIQYDGTPIMVGGLPPLIFIVRYNPAE